MCFRKLYGSTRQIAAEDIKCYKILEFDSPQSATAYHYNYRYLFHKVNIIPGLKLSSDTVEINRGFHSYIHYKSIERFRLKKRFSAILKGTKKSKVWFKSYYLEKRVAVRCVIPKGSFYWKNDTEYVSNQIIVEEFVK